MERTRGHTAALSGPVFSGKSQDDFFVRCKSGDVTASHRTSQGLIVDLGQDPHSRSQPARPAPSGSLGASFSCLVLSLHTGVAALSALQPCRCSLAVQSLLQVLSVTGPFVLSRHLFGDTSFDV